MEKSFLENPYPDPKKREELARMCNSIRSGDLTERERVTEQIVTHWFQNKRKLSRKSRHFEWKAESCCSYSLLFQVNADEVNGDLNPKVNDENQNFEVNGDSTSVEYDIESPANFQDFNDEIQLAAYKAIMSRMTTSPVRQELTIDLNEKSSYS